MKRIAIYVGKMGFLAAVLLTVGCPIAGSPVLSVIPLAINFGDTSTTDNIIVANIGQGTLTWDVSAPPAWLTVATTTPDLTAGQSSKIKLTADRSALGGTGSFSTELTITSNDGTQTVMVNIVNAGPQTPPELEFEPPAIDLGDEAFTNLIIRNVGGGTLTWDIVESIPWLVPAATAGETGAQSASSVRFSADRRGLAAGFYQGEVQLNTNDEDVTITATMNVAAEQPIIEVTPTSLSFAENESEALFTISNAGSGTLDWDAVTSVTTAGNWLQVSPANGSVTTDDTTVTVTVNRGNLLPSDYPDSITDFPGTITINSNTSDGNDPIVLNVTMTTKPTELVVSPLEIDFRTVYTSKLLAISNGGVGSLNWTITENIPWLTQVSPASGTAAAGDDADSVVLTVDRSSLAAGETAQGTILVSATDSLANPLTPIEVVVRIGKAEDPQLSVTVYQIEDPTLPDTIGSGTNERPQMRFGDQGDLVVRTMEITNVGSSGTVNWSINPANLEPWIVGFSQIQGAVVADDPSTPDDDGELVDIVAVEISREGIASGSYDDNIVIESNAGTVSVYVSMTVPDKRLFGTEPANGLSLGATQSVSSFSVANYGDDGTLLNYVLTDNAPWLFASPQTGSSIGTPFAPPLKDYQTINVAVDRFLLGGVASTGVITFSDLIDDAGQAPDYEFSVGVAPIELSIEGAPPRGRIPSMVRWPVILRDFKDRSVQDSAADFDNDAIDVWEAGVPLDLSETNQFLNDASNAKTHVAFMLDYSGSMLDSVADSGLLTGTAFTLQQMYGGPLNIPEPGGGGGFLVQQPQGIGGYFLSNLPSPYRVALLEFHDRSRPSYLVNRFTEDRAALIAALSGLNISDNGASEFFPAVTQAAVEHVLEDLPLVSFDDADIRVLVVISDGRLTTPSGDPSNIIQDAIDTAEAARMQVFAIGWGSDVNHEPMARLASETGGHYYFVPPEPDPNDPNILRPSVVNLLDTLERVIADLGSFKILSYTTLNEEPNVEVRYNLAHDIGDVYPVRPGTEVDRGIVQGSRLYTVDYSSVVGDVQLGQLSLFTDGIQSDGTATVYVRADYIPRNINKFQFEITSGVAFDSIDIVAPADGGLLGTGANLWTPTTPAVNTYRYDAAPPGTDAYLQYGAFGKLLAIRYSGLTPGVDDFFITFDVDNTIYAGDAEPKSFIAPDRIRVFDERAVAPAFPTPEVEPATLVLDVSDPSETLRIRNIGGYYPRTTSSILLNWAIPSPPTFLNISPISGTLTSNTVDDLVLVALDLSAPSGTYSSIMLIEYTTGTLGIGAVVEVPVEATIPPPVLGLNATAFTFPGGTDTDTLIIENTGYSTMEWVINNADTADWLTFELVGGSGSGATPDGELIHNQTDEVTLTVDRTGLASGNYATYFYVISNAGYERVDVTLQVP